MAVQTEPKVAEEVRIGDRCDSIWNIANEVFILCEYDPEEAEAMVMAEPTFTFQQRAAFSRAFDLMATTRNKES
jgi:hypothetical protein